MSGLADFECKILNSKRLLGLNDAAGGGVIEGKRGRS
jgi:hypothetical protein